MLSENTVNSSQLIGTLLYRQLPNSKSDAENSQSFAQEFSNLIDRSNRSDVSDKAADVDALQITLTLIAMAEPMTEAGASTRAANQDTPQMVIENSFAPTNTDADAATKSLLSTVPEKSTHSLGAKSSDITPLSTPSNPDIDKEAPQTIPRIEVEVTSVQPKANSPIEKLSDTPLTPAPYVDKTSRKADANVETTETPETIKAGTAPHPEARPGPRAEQSIVSFKHVDAVSLLPSTPEARPGPSAGQPIVSFIHADAVSLPPSTPEARPDPSAEQLIVSFKHADAVSLPPSTADKAIPQTVNNSEARASEKLEKLTQPQHTHRQVMPDGENHALTTSSPPIAEGWPPLHHSTAETARDIFVSPMAVTVAQAAPAAPATITTLQHPSLFAQSAVTVSALPDIVADLITTTDEAAERVIVRLDPPELGRVSVDFKFDALGLQTIIVTAETPEALRKLRSMHHELIQVLEQNGLSEKNLSLSGEEGRQHRQQNFVFEQLSALTPETTPEETEVTPPLTRAGAHLQNNKTPTTNGLNLKL